MGSMGFTLKERPKEETITSLEFANTMWPDQKPPMNKKSVKKKKSQKSTLKDAKTPRIVKSKSDKKTKASGKENKPKDDSEA